MNDKKERDAPACLYVFQFLLDNDFFQQITQSNQVHQHTNGRQAPQQLQPQPSTSNVRLPTSTFAANRGPRPSSRQGNTVRYTSL